MELDGFGRIQYAVRIEARKSPALDMLTLKRKEEKLSVLWIQIHGIWILGYSVNFERKCKNYFRRKQFSLQKKFFKNKKQKVALRNFLVE